MPREADLAALVELRNDLPTQHALLAAPQPNDRADVMAWIARRAGEPTTIFRVVANAADGAVGFVQIVAIDERSRHGTLGIAIGARQRGRGHGRAALEQVLALAAADGRLDKLVLHVATDNTAARALYRRLGFHEVGIHRRHYRSANAWHDVAVMERFLDPTSSEDRS